MAVLAECGGPEKLSKHLNGAGGQGGTSPLVGAAGDSGFAGTTSAAGTVGGAGGDSGLAGTVGAAGTGAAGVGAAGVGAAGTGAAGTGAAGTGAAGTAAAGTKGSAGAGGTTGAGGTAGPPDAGTDAPPSCNCKLTIQYQCRQNGASVLQAAFSIKIMNSGTTPIPLNTITARYWYTIDSTGAQTGTCVSAAHPCTVAFQATAAKAKADQYAVISFGGGTLAPGADTGEIAIDMHGTGAYTQSNDFSFLNTGANYYDREEVTGYVSGKLIWGIAP